MPSETFEQMLDRAASSHGIGPGYWDIWGRYHATSTEAKQVILRAKGIDAANAEALERSMAALSRREWERLLPPCIVARQAGEIELTLNVPAESAGAAARITIREEQGRVAESEVNLRDLPQTASEAIDGQSWVRKQVRVPAGLPLGYHEITVKVGDRSASTRYIVTPDRAWAPPHFSRGGRAAGVAISLYGVRSARNWGCGDFSDLDAIFDWAVNDLEVSFIGLNPLHAIHNRRPFNTSPYLPNCTFYQNYLYLDVEAMEDFAQSRRAQCLRKSPGVQSEIQQLRDAPFVEYERVAALKLRILKLAFVQFLREWRRDTPRAREFRAFLRARGRPARKVRHLLRARRVAAPRRPECVDVDPVARALPGSRIPRDPRLPAKALAHGDVPPVPRVADRYPVGPRRSSGRGNAAWRSGSTTTWRWPPIASGRTCGRTGGSS